MPAYSQQSEDTVSGVLDVRPPQINYTAFGLLIQNFLPLWEDMWHETPQREIVTLLDHAADFKALPAMNTLVYRLLISQSYPPKTLEGTLLSNLPYARAKIDWLIANGYGTEALRLMNFIPEAYRFSWFGREWIDLNFLNGNYGEVCKIINNISLQDMPLYTEKVKIFCLLLANQLEEAEFLFTLYMDRGNVDDDLLFFQIVNYSLYELLPERGYLALELARLLPLHLAMLTTINVRVTIKDATLDVEPLLLSMLLRTGNLDLENRILMAEKLLLLRPDDAVQVRNLYALFALNLQATNEEINPKDEGLSVSHKLALLYARLVADKFPNQKAIDLKTALDLGKKDERFSAVVHLLRDELLALPVDKDRAWFANDMIHALLALGEMDTARLWYAIIDEDSKDKRGLLPFLMSLNTQSIRTETGGEQRLEEISIRPGVLWPNGSFRDKRLHEKELRVLDTLLAVYYWKIPDTDPQILTEFAEMRDLWLSSRKGLYFQSVVLREPMWTLVSLFERLIDENRKGHAVLLANLLLSSQFVLSPGTLVTVLAGLERMGLAEEATVIAREYILLHLMD